VSVVDSVRRKIRQRGSRGCGTCGRGCAGGRNAEVGLKVRPTDGSQTAERLCCRQPGASDVHGMLAVSEHWGYHAHITSR